MGRRIKASLFACDTVWIAGFGRGVRTSGNEGSRLAGHLWYWEQRRGSET